MIEMWPRRAPPVVISTLLPRDKHAQNDECRNQQLSLKRARNTPGRTIVITNTLFWGKTVFQIIINV